MASTWNHPWLGIFEESGRLKWSSQFAWLPKRSQQSGKRIWLTKAWYGTRLIWGPAGESPVRVEQWLTDDEYIWFQLTNV